MADHSTDEGYTMLELVTVMCIMLVLGAIATVSSNMYLNHARNTALKSDVNYAGKAVSAYLGMYGTDSNINVSVSGEQLKLINTKGDVLTQKVSASDAHRILDTAFVQDMSAWCIGMAEKRTGKKFFVEVDSGSLSEPREGSCSSVGYDATKALTPTPTGTSTSTPTPTPTDTGPIGGGGGTATTAPTSSTSTTTPPPPPPTSSTTTTTTTTTPPVTTSTTTTTPVTTTTTTTTPPVTTSTTTTPPVTTTTTTTPKPSGTAYVLAQGGNPALIYPDKASYPHSTTRISEWSQPFREECNLRRYDTRISLTNPPRKCIRYRINGRNMWVPSPWSKPTGSDIVISVNQAPRNKFVW